MADPAETALLARAVGQVSMQEPSVSTSATTSRAVRLESFGGPEVLVIREIPEPEPKDGHVVIEVKAFGLNHAELHMRKGEWAEIADVSGIECVGVVKSCPGGEFAPGILALVTPDSEEDMRPYRIGTSLELRRRS